jgi:DNA (cytosine-5)-methyltransferase 1
MMRVLDLFSGIGGFTLGLERAGMHTIAFCESDAFCRAVLAQHWPDIPCHHDVRCFDGLPADVVVGGFPCQDISIAGSGDGLAGTRSGLWREFTRILGNVRPHYAIVENVSALLHRGLGEVLADLASLGFDAEWHCIPAAAIGAPHQRDRVWIVAHAHREGRQQFRLAQYRDLEGALWGELDRCGARGSIQTRLDDSNRESTRHVHDGQKSYSGPGYETDEGERCAIPAHGRDWAIEPDVGRVADGIPARTHRLRSLGNALVPQIAQAIGDAIMRGECSHSA